MIEWDIDKLLLSCVRARYHDDELEEAGRLVRDGAIDWDQFLRQARLHNIAPLVYDTLRDESTILPPWVSDALRASYYWTARHNALLYEELAALVRAFDEAEIPLILLKGAALAQGTYGNVALRPMGDLDLLVRSDAMAKAEALLSLRGYLVLNGSDSHLRHMTVRHPHSSSGAHVEVHRHVVSSPYYRTAIAEEWLWWDPVARGQHCPQLPAFPGSHRGSGNAALALRHRRGGAKEGRGLGWARPVRQRAQDHLACAFATADMPRDPGRLST